MKLLSMPLFILTGLLLLGPYNEVFSAAPKSYEPLEVVDYVDIEAYMGTWYEIAKLPNRFQKDCAGTKAHYQLGKRSRVDVLNSCQDMKDPYEVSTANGTARVVDSQTNAKLKVSFVPFFRRFGWFAGDYWILELDNNYEYVLIGTPSREYLWILSRTPRLDEATIEKLLTYAEDRGFDVEKVKRTPEWID